MRISDWSSDVCSSDLAGREEPRRSVAQQRQPTVERFPRTRGQGHQPFLVALAANDQIFAFARHRAARKRHEFARAEPRSIEKFEQQQHSHRARGWRLAGRLLHRLLEQPFDIISAKHTSELQSLMPISNATTRFNKKTPCTTPLNNQPR